MRYEPRYELPQVVWTPMFIKNPARWWFQWWKPKYVPNPKVSESLIHSALEDLVFKIIEPLGISPEDTNIILKDMEWKTDANS